MKQNSHIPEGYKDSLLGIIPKEWIVKKLGEILAGTRLGGNYENAESHKGIPVIKMGNIERGKISVEKILYLPEGSMYNREDVLKKGDLLLNTRNTLELVGKVAIWRNELPLALYNSNLLRMQFRSEYIDSNWYMNYSFNSYSSIKQLRRYATGTTSVAAIYSRDLFNLKIALPSLGEQQKIAEILSVWDEAIEKQTQLIAKLETRKRGLMQQLLTGEKRLKGFCGEWDIVTLGKLFYEISESNDSGSHEVMTISARQGLVSQNDKFDRIIAGESLGKYTLIKENDFAYNKGNSNSYEMGCIYQLEDTASALVPFVYICFRPTEKICSKFYKYWFYNHGLDRQLKRIITSGARGDGLLNVNKRDFFRLLLPYPPPKEQTAIANILSDADNEIDLAKQKLANLKEQKKGLMQVLLTGKKRVAVL